jgi:DNA-binding PucR family transcriptional regulator
VLGAVERSFASKFVVDMQSKFAEVDDEEMWATIEAFLASNQNVSETAKRLYVHRNTLIYRLDRFKAATGLDVRLFEDAVVVKLYRSLVVGVRNLY